MVSSSQPEDISPTILLLQRWVCRQLKDEEITITITEDEEILLEIV